MSAGTTATHRAIHALLACLTLIAAYMFPMRMDALGSMNPPERTISGPELLARALNSTETCGRNGTAHAQEHSAPTHHTSHEKGERHGAHCPFCLTNAFALEASITGLPQGPPHAAPAVETRRVQAFASALRHADARAPPTL